MQMRKSERTAKPTDKMFKGKQQKNKTVKNMKPVWNVQCSAVQCSVTFCTGAG